MVKIILINQKPLCFVAFAQRNAWTGTKTIKKPPEGGFFSLMAT
jgi:hypothetical protein